MITVTVRGVDEAQEFLRAVSEAATKGWEGPLASLGGRLTRFAMSISPVITGSYAGAHRAAVSGQQLQVYIDPSARNSRSGVPVTGYAGSVERRHNVYGRVGREAGRFAAQWPDDMAKEMGL